MSPLGKPREVISRLLVQKCGYRYQARAVGKVSCDPLEKGAESDRRNRCNGRQRTQRVLELRRPSARTHVDLELLHARATRVGCEPDGMSIHDAVAENRGRYPYRRVES